MGNTGLSTGAAQGLRQTARDVIEAGQILDVIHNRSFRQSLLCRADVTLNRSIAPAVIEPFYLACQVAPQDQQGDAPAQAAMAELAAAWPLPVRFPELAERAATRCGTALDAASLRSLAIYLLGLSSRSPELELSLLPPVFQTTIATRPEALPLASWQAAHGLQVVNGRHENCQPGKDGRALLGMLDGTCRAEEIFAQHPAWRETMAQLSAAALLARTL